MAIDNTHTKYLHGRDKKAWQGYREALEAQRKLENLFDSMGGPELAEGEEYEVPMRKRK